MKLPRFDPRTYFEISIIAGLACLAIFSLCVGSHNQSVGVVFIIGWVLIFGGATFLGLIRCPHCGYEYFERAEISEAAFSGKCCSCKNSFNGPPPHDYDHKDCGPEKKIDTPTTVKNKDTRNFRASLFSGYDSALLHRVGDGAPAHRVRQENGDPAGIGNALGNFGLKSGDFEIESRRGRMVSL